MRRLTLITFGLAAIVSGAALAEPRTAMAKGWACSDDSIPGPNVAERRRETCWRTNRQTGQKFRIC